MKKDRFFTWKTKTGCIRLLTLFLALILVFSFSARMVSTVGGTIKNVRVTFDSRGATVDGELYYPAGTSDADKLPAVLVAHGAAIGNTALKGMSEELARRGYVVLNSSAYNMGLSEQPISDENGYGEAQFGRGGTPHGLQDSIEFLRSLNFVDQTRIGIVGHSLGARRGGYVIGNDCGHYTFNDILINILYDTFGQRFTEAEINEDADALAAARLNADQLAHYNQLRDEAWQKYNTRVLALCLVGYSANDVPDTRAQAVEVAGHEVLRNCQANLGLLSGVYDFGHATYPNKDETKADWYTNGESIQPSMWYAIDDVTQTSAVLGGMDDISVANDQALAQAIHSRSSRIFSLTQESHAKNNFSVETNTEVVKYFQQVFSYNRGELSSASAKPLDPNNSVFMWRENLNLAAMISMILAVLALAGVLLHTAFFAPCAAEQTASAAGFQKKWYWIFGGAGAVLAFITIWRVNGIFGFKLPYLEFLPFAEPWWYSILFLAVTAGVSLALLALAWLRDRKTSGLEGLKGLNVAMKVSTILKTVLLGMVLICFAYLTLVVIEDLFNQDYRLWMATFTEMKIENWAYVWRFAILFLPCFLAIGSLTNYMVRQDIPEWLDTLLTVIINSVGVWVCCLVDIFFMFVLKSSFSSFISTYQMLIIIPITVYITRKSYKLTNSVWLGAVLNALLLGWSICSGTGMNLDHYLPQTWASVFFSI